MWERHPICHHGSKLDLKHTEWQTHEYSPCQKWMPFNSRLMMWLSNWAFSMLAAANQLAPRRGWYVLPMLLPGWCISSVIDWARCSTATTHNPSLPQVVILFFYCNPWTCHVEALGSLVKLQIKIETFDALKYFLYLKGKVRTDQREFYLFLAIIAQQPHVSLFSCRIWKISNFPSFAFSNQCHWISSLHPGTNGWFNRDY